MIKAVRLLTIFMLTLAATTSSAIMHLTLTQGVNSAIPISISPFSDETASDNIQAIIVADLQNSGRFKNHDLHQPSSTTNVYDDTFWKQQKVNYVLLGSEQVSPDKKLLIKVALYDIYHNANNVAPIYQATYHIQPGQVRALGHYISDTVYQKIVGVRGVFSTKLAYVAVHQGQKGVRYQLMLSDYDGENATPLVISKSPIMSPSWSPDGQRLAYVSFETGLPAIYISNVATGKRQLVTDFPGLNSSPMFSPDGKRLVIVSSRHGTPAIYTVNLSSGQLRRLTQISAINTGPAWSANGQQLLFTSNRGGTPQIYQISPNNKRLKRLSFSGDYNADAHYLTAHRIVMLHRGQDTGQQFSIALKNLKTGVLTPLVIDAVQSPSPAPNGSMIVYTKAAVAGRSQLALISTNGNAKLGLTTSHDSLQSPVWSPFLKPGDFHDIS